MLLITFFGCGISELDLPSGQRPIVVEGWISDQESRHEIKLSRTVPFDQLNSEEPITDAIVVIEDNISSQIQLSHTGDGIYKTPLFQGIPGTSYRARIELSSGEILISEWEFLNETVPIENLSPLSFDSTDPETGEDIVVFYPRVILEAVFTVIRFIHRKTVHSYLEIHVY